MILLAVIVFSSFVCAVDDSWSIDGLSTKKGNKDKWTKKDDVKLAGLVTLHGEKWSKIALSFPGREGKQCRERWCYQLDPSITKKPWTAEEDATICKKQQEIGNKWAKIAEFLPGRPDNAIKNRWNTALKEKAVRPSGSSPISTVKKRKAIGSEETPKKQKTADELAETSYPPTQLVIRVPGYSPVQPEADPFCYDDAYSSDCATSSNYLAGSNEQNGWYFEDGVLDSDLYSSCKSQNPSGDGDAREEYGDDILKLIGLGRDGTFDDETIFPQGLGSPTSPFWPYEHDKRSQLLSDLLSDRPVSPLAVN